MSKILLYSFILAFGVDVRAAVPIRCDSKNPEITAYLTFGEEIRTERGTHRSCSCGPGDDCTESDCRELEYLFETRDLEIEFYFDGGRYGGLFSAARYFWGGVYEPERAYQAHGKVHVGYHYDFTLSTTSTYPDRTEKYLVYLSAPGETILLRCNTGPSR
ncbi:MAG: hypothetical protein V4692_09390 [Bdellovibrionota bacterium]